MKTEDAAKILSSAVLPDARCKICGCTDSRACLGGCSWASVDRKRRTGVCSNCAGKKSALKKGGRKR